MSECAWFRFGCNEWAGFRFADFRFKTLLRWADDAEALWDFGNVNGAARDRLRTLGVVLGLELTTPCVVLELATSCVVQELARAASREFDTGRGSFASV